MSLTQSRAFSSILSSTSSFSIHFFAVTCLMSNSSCSAGSPPVASTSHPPTVVSPARAPATRRSMTSIFLLKAHSFFHLFKCPPREEPHVGRRQFLHFLLSTSSSQGNFPSDLAALLSHVTSHKCPPLFGTVPHALERKATYCCRACWDTCESEFIEFLLVRLSAQ